MNVFLDAKQADENKLKAMAEAYESSPEHWRLSAFHIVAVLAYLMPSLTSDDVWKILYKPPNAKALGPIMRKMAAIGYIEKTGKTVRTEQTSRNGTDINTWHSRVYGTQPPPGLADHVAYWKAQLGL